MSTPLDPCADIRPVLPDHYLGLLEIAEHRRVDAHLQYCEPCSDERLDVEADLMPLGDLLAARVRASVVLDEPAAGEAPSATDLERLRERVERLVAADVERRRDAIVESVERSLPDGATFLARTTGAWEPVRLGGIEVRGARAKVLNVDDETDRRTVLLQLDAGASLPAHRHHDDEESFLLHGDLRYADADGREVVLHAGDYQRLPASTDHTVQVTRGGCLAIVIGSIHDASSEADSRKEVPAPQV